MTNQNPDVSKDGVSREEAENAVRTLLRWAGEDPTREGLVDTPKRVVKAYADWFSGYQTDPAEYLRRTFEEVCGYDEMVVLRDIQFESFCEHHMAPIIGRAHIGYLPGDRILGLSKFARVVELFARRPQVQEQLTTQIVEALMEHLNPRGAMVVIECEHMCMSMRGVRKPGAKTVTSAVRGQLREPATRAEAMSLILGK